MAPERKAKAKASPEPDDWYWEVVGGAESGGLVVREDCDAWSAKLPERLAHGAWIREMEIAGGRMRYVKLLGDGPREGWVCMTLKEKELLQKCEIFYNISDDEEEPQQNGAARKTQPVPKDQAPPKEPGTGHLYRVVAAQVAIRSAPSLAGAPQFSEKRGAVVELFEWDESQRWRMTVDRCGRAGWMMLDHPQHGALLRPKEMQFQRDPLPPLCVAAMESSIGDLQRFMDCGNDLAEADSTGFTALMRAAQADFVDGVVLLLHKGAKASAQTPDGLTAADLAAEPSTRELILALSLRDFKEGFVLEAVSRLRDETRPLAERLLQVPLRMHYERDQERQQAASAARRPPGGRQEAAPAPAAVEEVAEEGEPFRVVYARVPIRAEPSKDALIVSNAEKGEIVIVLDYDSSGRWLNVKREWTDHKDGSAHPTAWMLAEDRDFGPLLEPLL